MEFCGVLIRDDMVAWYSVCWTGMDWTPGQGFPDWRLRKVIVFCSLLSQCIVFVFREMKVQVTMENQDMMVQSHTVKVSNHDQHYNEKYYKHLFQSSVIIWKNFFAVGSSVCVSYQSQIDILDFLGNYIGPVWNSSIKTPCMVRKLNLKE